MDSTEERKTRYRDLVRRVRDSYKNGFQELIWCDACEEINLWTYWQGRNFGEVQILVAGQDWGAPELPEAASVMENVRRMNRGEKVSYMDGNKSLTDRNLIRLFASIGCPLPEDGTADGRVFFTNLVLGYWQGTISGGLKSGWIQKDAPFFRELAEILDPKVIICLGKETFRGVLKAFGAPIPRSLTCFNDFLEGCDNPVIVDRNGKDLFVFASAHPGALGVMNRNRGTETHEDKLYRLKKDWEKIGKVMKSL